MNDMKQTFPDFRLIEWINEYDVLSGQRMIGHDLNNFLTPLAMQVSMLKNQLNTGEIEKAIERIQKLERAVEKLKTYSHKLLSHSDTPVSRDSITSHDNLIQAFEHVTTVPQLQQVSLSYQLNALKTPFVLDEKMISLFCYAYLMDNVQHTKTYTIHVELDDSGRILINLQNSSVGEVSDTSGTTPSLKTLTRYSKVVNTCVAGYHISLPNTNSSQASLIITN